MLRVAIDGPGGTGKSTIAKAIGAKFNYFITTESIRII